jgi:hypothetical protein
VVAWLDDILAAQAVSSLWNGNTNGGNNGNNGGMSTSSEVSSTLACHFCPNPVIGAVSFWWRPAIDDIGVAACDTRCDPAASYHASFVENPGSLQRRYWPTWPGKGCPRPAEQVCIVHVVLLASRCQSRAVQRCPAERCHLEVWRPLSNLLSQPSPSRPVAVRKPTQLVVSHRYVSS